MLYPNLKAVYRKGTLKLLTPLRIPDGTTVQISVQTTNVGAAEQIMKFAGAWQDMPEATFNDFLTEVQQRRRFAFSRRRNRETVNG